MEIGIDLVELHRIEAILKRKPRFTQRVLTPKELTYFQELSLKRKIEFLAGRFAVKEAYSKAIGYGLGRLTFQMIECLPSQFGKPLITQGPIIQETSVSISHTKTMVQASVLIALSQDQIDQKLAIFFDQLI